MISPAGVVEHRDGDPRRRDTFGELGLARRQFVGEVVGDQPHARAALGTSVNRWNSAAAFWPLPRSTRLRSAEPPRFAAKGAALSGSFGSTPGSGLPSSVRKLNSAGTSDGHRQRSRAAGWPGWREAEVHVAVLLLEGLVARRGGRLRRYRWRASGSEPGLCRPPRDQSL